MTLTQEQVRISEILRGSHSLPFLFVGSGLSLRYLSTKNWEGLLRHFALIVGNNDLAYEKYRTKAMQSLVNSGREVTKNSLFTAIADLIESDFNELWFTDPYYEESRKQHRKEIQDGVSPFKLEIANLFKYVNLESIPSKYSEEIHLLKKIGHKSIAGVITTNYDPFLNLLYPNYNVYVGQEELIFSETLGVNELYKIHGCCTNPKSIIINSRDYQDFDKRNAYLAAKLMTIFVEHPIVFIGYSLDDENIQAIIRSIVDCLSEEKLDKLRDRFIFIEWKSGHPTTDVFPHSRDFGNGKSISMTKVVTDSYVDLFNIILENKSKYPTKFLRKLKQDIYNLALTSEATGKLFVNMPTNEDELNSDDVEVVIGFGILEYGKQGYKGIPAEKVFQDIVFDDQNFINKLLVEDTFPTLLKRVANSLPVFKYIRDYHYDQLPECLKPFKKLKFRNFETQTILKDRAQFGFSSISEALRYAKGDLKKEVRYLQTLEERNIDVNELGSYLKTTLSKNPDILISKDQILKTGVKKLIKIYDYLKYKK